MLFKHMLAVEVRFRPVGVGLLLFVTLLFQCSIVSQIDRGRIEEITRGPRFSTYDGLKRRIAVLNFANLTEHGGDKIGSALSDMLVGVLVRSGRFVVVERQEVNTILGEQALGQSGAITEETAIHAGRLLGVQSLILGTVEELRQESAARDIKPEDKDWKLSLKATVGFVRLRFRVINTFTGEVALADEVTGFEMRPGFGIKTREFDFEDMHDFDQTVIGLACRKAINQIAISLVKGLSYMDWYGKVVKVEDNGILYFTPGKNSGIKIGDVFDICEAGMSDMSDVDENVIAPESRKGRIKVVGFVGQKVSRATILWGKNIQPGDWVKEAGPKAETIPSSERK